MTSFFLPGILLSGHSRVQKHPGFLKKPNPLGFLGFVLYWVFGFLYLNEQPGSLLVDRAHQLSFY